MAIKNYKKAVYIDQNGNTLENFPDYIGMLAVIVSMPSYCAAPKMSRVYCRCGWADSFDGCMKCPNCGNELTYHFNQNYNRFSSADLYSRAFIKDNQILYPEISVEFDATTSTTKFIEIPKLYLSKDEKKDFGINKRYVSNKDHDSVFLPLLEEMMENDPLWDEVNRLYGVVFSIAEKYQSMSRSELAQKIWLYNVLKSLPWCRNEEYLAALTSLKAVEFNQVFLTEEDFLSYASQPKLLFDLYPMFGFMSDPIPELDNLNESIKKVIRTAVIHRHVTINDLWRVLEFGYHNHAEDPDQVAFINSLGDDFPDFFRKNVIELGDELIDVYELLHQSGYSSLKEYNYSKLKEYLVQKKRIKAAKTSELDECFNSGNMLQFIKLLG